MLRDSGFAVGRYHSKFRPEGGAKFVTFPDAIAIDWGGLTDGMSSRSNLTRLTTALGFVSVGLAFAP